MQEDESFVTEKEIGFFEWGQKLNIVTSKHRKINLTSDQQELFKQSDEDFVYWWMSASADAKKQIIQYWEQQHDEKCNERHLDIIAERLSNIKRNIYGKDVNDSSIEKINELFQLMMSGCFNLRDNHDVIKAIMATPNYKCSDLWNFLEPKYKIIFARHINRWIMYSSLAAPYES